MHPTHYVLLPEFFAKATFSKLISKLLIRGKKLGLVILTMDQFSLRHLSPLQLPHHYPEPYYYQQKQLRS